MNVCARPARTAAGMVGLLEKMMVTQVSQNAQSKTNRQMALLIRSAAEGELDLRILPGISQ